jgi:Transposase DDE domain group 1
VPILKVRSAVDHRDVFFSAPEKAENTKLCTRFPAARLNAVRLQLHALAYNLGNFLRTLATPEPINDWSLTSLKERLIKTGGKICQPSSLCRFPDGRSRRSEHSLCRHPATDRGVAAATRYIDSVVSSVLTSATKLPETCVLMTEKFGIPRHAPASRPSPKTYLQATAGSQRHFSLVKVSPWTQFQPR